jgi:uncharacterized membrane protein YoaK (UPF0700 family)
MTDAFGCCLVQDGWWRNSLFLAIAVIFLSSIAYFWHKRRLNVIARTIFDIIVVLFTIIAFLFPDIELWKRIMVIVILVMVGIILNLTWSRINERILIQSPIVSRKGKKR